MSRKVFVPLMIAFLVVSMLIVTAGLYAADGLPANVTYSINRLLTKLDSSGSSKPANTNSTPEDTVSYQPVITSLMPKDINAVAVDMDKDISTPADGTSSYGAFVTETENYFNYFKNFITEAIFLTPDYAGKFESFYDAYGNKVDVQREYIKYADAESYFKVLVITDECIFADNKLTYDRVQYYLSNYPFDAVLLSSASLTANHGLASAVAFFGEKIRTGFGGGIYFGAELPSSSAAKYADQDTLAALNSGMLDFAVIEGNAMNSPSLPFAAVMNWWNSLAANYPSITFYCKHRNDLVLSNTAEWNNYIEICDQVRALWECENICGSIFYSASSLRANKSSSSVRLAYLCFDGFYDDLAVKSIQINPQNNTVEFTGSNAAGYKVICNGRAIANTADFKYSAVLNAGENAFTFFSRGKKLTYNIYNNTRIIYSYSPQADLNALSGETVGISAICLDGSKVQCTINGKTYTMAKSYSMRPEGVPEGYSLYSCGVKFSGNSHSDVFLGDLVISATLEDNTENVTCGAITVLQSENTGFMNKLIGYFSSDETSKTANSSNVAYSDHVSPYHDNGLGNALLCRIIKDDTEQLGGLDEKNTFHADESTLPEGTLDYIAAMEVSDKGYLRYKLKSGITVYGINCELINNGFVLPANKIAVDHVDDSSPTATDIVFNIDWFSPVTVKCKPQTYTAGYESYTYNISSFTAEYVEVKFFYAGEFYNSSLLQFSETSPFSHSELYTEGDQNLILRLYLKKVGQFYGFDIYRNEQNQLVLSFKKHSDGSLQGKVIMLDPGHGGLSMTGTALADESIAEKTVTLAIALKAKEMLEVKGATVIMTRTMDTSLTLDERAAMITEKNPDLFVSIHCDGTSSATDAGTHSFYFRPYSQPLADAINTSLANVYKTNIYSPTDTNYTKVDKAIKYYPFFVTRMNQCPSVLVETGFMTNPVEGKILAEDNTQYWLAHGITEGITSYFANNY